MTKEQINSIANYRQKIMSVRSAAPKNASISKKLQSATNPDSNSDYRGSQRSSQGKTISPAKGSVIGCSEQTPQKTYADPKPAKPTTLLQRASKKKGQARHNAMVFDTNKESYASTDSYLPAL